MAPSENATPEAPVLEGGTYEIIRNRLLGHADALSERLDKLNQSRREIFGTIEQSLLATDRITTANNCTPRDMAAVGGSRFLFGYNVHVGLRSETRISDVFAVYAYEEKTFRELPTDMLKSGRFEDDFQNLYKYYKGVRFAKFERRGPHLFMVFRTGPASRDFKTFKWLLADDGLTYVDNRSDHELKPPAQHDFEWNRTTRDWHRPGQHPHISIEDRVFVEAVGGDITFKVEDNTDTGQGIYAEPVDDPDQTLDDAEIHYAAMGHLILVRIKPYQETAYRHFIFNEKVQTVVRLDEMADACVRLPDDQGLIFSSGYYLGSGELKRFEGGLSGMMFEGRIASPNGEDYLYTFHHPESGDYVLLSYNLIAQTVETPIRCNGFFHFDSGEMILFRADAEPARHHVIQIWRTPYLSGEHAFAEQSDAYLFKVGNKSIVRCMAECGELPKLIRREEMYPSLYVDLVKKAGDITDAYFWIDRPEAFHLKPVLQEIKTAASAAIDEFEKLIRLRKNAADQARAVEASVREIIARLTPEHLETIDGFVQGLADLRTVRGKIVSLRELRYADIEKANELEAVVAETTERISGQCVDFLLDPAALDPYERRITEAAEAVDALAKVTDADALGEQVAATGRELEMLIDIVSNLKIDDATRTTRIIEQISECYARLNQVRAALKNRRKSLASVEGTAQFAAQIKLLDQSIVNYLDICETPDQCDEYLTKIMVSVEDLESRFSEFDEFLTTLSEKRDEVYNAFESRKLRIVEDRNRRASALMAAAERILKGVQNRVAGFDDVSAIGGYFAGDLMVAKVRDIVAQLLALEDTVKADDIQSRLKTLREDAVRQLKDRQELFEAGADIIRLGRHRFTVNVRPLDLTVVRRDGRQWFHLTGTGFFQPIADETFQATESVWDMELPSEDGTVYRAEYLAYRMLMEGASPDGDNSDAAAWVETVRNFMAPRYNEGYTKGVHDLDGAAIVSVLHRIHFACGLLKYSPKARVLARLFWRLWPDADQKRLMADRLAGFGAMKTLMGNASGEERYVAALTEAIAGFTETAGVYPADLALEAARYLFEERTGQADIPEPRFTVSAPARDLADDFSARLVRDGAAARFKDARERLASEPLSEFGLIRDWVASHATGTDPIDFADEAALVLFTGDIRSTDVVNTPLSADIDGMTGTHPVIENGAYRLVYHRFMEKLRRFEETRVPLFTQYTALKKSLTEEMRETLRLSEYKPRVLSSFVRNKLVNEVYLPLIGDNLAKQIGVAGEAKRTDLMGLLLLISPPGYGKTTLMEYIASRLGIIFMKINGPAMGSRVTSLDPDEAPNAAAREEVRKINLALEMGDNVMIYLDDIQHLNAELLQKFISLCDAQRKIEGVFNGKSRTYDLRGKKVVVVMAGNPYTESGEKFRIPDMLANRADTYNLGDIIGDTEAAFKLSYLENAVTSNAVLNPLASRSQKDIYAVIRLAETGDRDGVELEGNWGPEELQELVLVMQKLVTLREVILKVNLAYIASAAQADEYRTEPPFLLQGSYRNMNRIAEKVVPVMNAEEMRTLILSHYESEAQTLTTGAEANLLKFKELTGWMTPEEAKRWEDIKKTFRKNLLLRGAAADNPVTQVVAQLSAFQDGLTDIRDAITREGGGTRIDFSEQTLDRLSELAGNMKDAVAAASDDRQEQAALLKVIQSQFEVMNGWMAPILENSRQTGQNIQKLARDIQGLKSVYRELMQAGPSDLKAIEQFDLALKINPRDDATYYKRGLALYNRGDTARALQDFKNALDLSPKNKKYQRIVAHLEAELTTDKRER